MGNIVILTPKLLPVQAPLQPAVAGQASSLAFPTSVQSAQTPALVPLMMTSGASQGAVPASYQQISAQQQYQVAAGQPVQASNPMPLMSQAPQFAVGTYTQPQAVQQTNIQPAEQFVPGQPAGIPQLMQPPVQAQSLVESAVPIGGDQLPQYQQYGVPQQQVMHSSCY